MKFRLGGLAAAFLAAALVLPTSASAQDVITDPLWPVDTKGDGCSTPTWPVAPPEDDARRVLIIGDSLTRNARPMLEAALTRRGWLPTVRCWGAKGSEWGVEQVQRARALQQLPDTIIVSLGTNDIWWLHVPMEETVDRMMQEIGPHHTVYWINLFFGPSGYDDLPRPFEANRILREKTAEYPNLRIINFAGGYRAAMKADPKVGWDDGVHLNAAGNRARTRIIVQGLGLPPQP